MVAYDQGRALGQDDWRAGRPQRTHEELKTAFGRFSADFITGYRQVFGG